MRINEKPLTDYSWWIRLLFWLQSKKYGSPLYSSRAWARSPHLFLGLSFFYGRIDRKNSPLDPALRSLVTVRVSQINDCAFCIDVNSATLLERGVSIEKLTALTKWRESRLFTEKEGAVLQYAEAMTRSDLRVTDTDASAVKKYFSEEAFVELTGLIAFQNMSTKFNNALGIPAQGFCVRP